MYPREFRQNSISIIIGGNEQMKKKKKTTMPGLDNQNSIGLYIMEIIN